MLLNPQTPLFYEFRHIFVSGFQRFEFRIVRSASLGLTRAVFIGDRNIIALMRDGGAINK